MRDVVELFGPNFSVTMETVFTTLENTIRMLRTTGDNRAFKKKELKEQLDRLEQAIAVVFEDSLANKMDDGSSSWTPRSCQYHADFVDKLLKAKDDMISFNYDCVLDYALRAKGDGKWNPRYGYSFKLGSLGRLLTGDEYWCPTIPAKEANTAHLYKLHGSLHYQISGDEDKQKVRLKQRPYTSQYGDMQFTIIPPELHKAFDKGAFPVLWKNAAAAIHRAKHIICIGYSVPTTDMHASALFRTSVQKNSLKSLVVVNPDKNARLRTRAVFQRGLRAETKVLSFDTFEHFIAAKRNLWEI
jgi:hypothetical protein